MSDDDIHPLMKSAPMKRMNLLLVTLMVSAAAHGQNPSFDPRSWKRAHAGPPTQAMVLGSVHLSEVTVPVSLEMLTPLLDKLATFRPTIITPEGMSGRPRQRQLSVGALRLYFWPQTIDRLPKCSGKGWLPTSASSATALTRRC